MFKMTIGNKTNMKKVTYIVLEVRQSREGFNKKVHERDVSSDDGEVDESKRV